MCTSFIYRDLETYIGMNFDNNGMKFSIKEDLNGWFVIFVDGGRGKYPSFGVNKYGQFVNNLVVNSNGKGLYRRPSTKVTHTTKLISDIINGTLLSENIKDYLDRVEVVNSPDWSCHNMIIDQNDNVLIVEPGRGNLLSMRNESKYFVMANNSIIDIKNGIGDDNCERYRNANAMLCEIQKMDIYKAFNILEKISQIEGEWKTSFSMVFSKQNRTIHYCFDGNYKNLQKYVFE